MVVSIVAVLRINRGEMAALMLRRDAEFEKATGEGSADAPRTLRGREADRMNSEGSEREVESEDSGAWVGLEGVELAGGGKSSGTFSSWSQALAARGRPFGRNRWLFLGSSAIAE